MRWVELISNRGGRLSTTAFIQFFGFIISAIVMIYCVWTDKSYLPELFSTFFWGCLGTAATKGAVAAYQHTHKYREEDYHQKPRSGRRKARTINNYVEEDYE